MSRYEYFTLALSALNLFVLSATLMVVLKYTRETVKIARAAAEQMPRPCVDLAEARDSSDLALLERLSTSLEQWPNLRFRNCGTGPAVNFRWSVHDAAAPPTSNFWIAGPSLAPGESFESAHSRNALPDVAAVLCEYESLGGIAYRCEMLVEQRKWIRSFKFREVAA